MAELDLAAATANTEDDSQDDADKQQDGRNRNDDNDPWNHPKRFAGLYCLIGRAVGQGRVDSVVAEATDIF